MSSNLSGIVVGIDASRNRSGGARAHLAGILDAGNPAAHGIREVHVWAFKALLDSLPERPWLVKHSPGELESSLARQLWWQATQLSREVIEADCDILFTTDASTVCRFKPMVVLSQDVLSYEPGALRHFRYSRQVLRLLAILIVQNRAFRFADGVIFLTHHAAKVIQRSCGPISRIAYIPHGVGAEFRLTRQVPEWPHNGDRPIRALYVSNAELYKHQWVVIQAIELLRKRGHNIVLTLLGGGHGPAQRQLERQMARSDPEGKFVRQLGFVAHSELPAYMAQADVFVFASSCEAFGITLLEAMSIGLPIACSNRSCLPELASDGAVYFDPEHAESIAEATEQIIKDDNLRASIAQRAKILSEGYSWARCADQTWAFIAETFKTVKA
jgi:glycosyltransferase involved in cell wall biosynthesis